jgi:peptide/nickel transport system substrate-binding protein
MDQHHSQLSRRQALLLGGSVAAALSGGWPGGAFGQEGTLRAGITGYNVINTLDPGKATLIPEF